MTLAMLCLSAGFIVWIGPLIERSVTAMQNGLWHRMAFKMLKWFAFAVVTILAAASAHDLVSRSTGLPPIDFPLSIAWWTICFFPLAWALLICLATFIGAIALIVAHILRRFRDAVPFLPPVTAPNLFIERGIGAMTVLLMLIGIASEYSGWLYSLKAPALWFAYVTEYHPLNNYPNIDSSLHARVHSNGVVSYAEVVNGQIQLRVTSLPR